MDQISYESEGKKKNKPDNIIDDFENDVEKEDETFKNDMT
jgi:hypothetical protein